MQVIDLDGTIAGCWLYETESEETFYYNKNLNPSGMCASPHYCVQYTDCIAEGEPLPANYEVLYVAPTPAPTTQAPTSEQQGIDIANIFETDEPTPAPTREEPSYPTHTILLVATILLVSLAAISGFIATKTAARADINYPSDV